MSIPCSQINFSNFRFGTDHLELQGKDEKVEPSNVEEASFGDWVSGGHERNHFCEEPMSHQGSVVRRIERIERENTRSLFSLDFGC